MLATMVVSGFRNNGIFDLSSSDNRDNILYPFWRLREEFKARGVLLNTGDINAGKEVGFEIHMDVQKYRSTVPAYVFLWETPLVSPANVSETRLARYRRIFSWNDSLVDGGRCRKFCLPVTNDSDLPPTFGWDGRDRFCCVIAGNKSLKKHDSRDLYSKRVETIRWFESHAPQDFDLYGTGWNIPPARPGLIGKGWSKIAPKIYRGLSRRPFPSYRGRVQRKHDTLVQHRFSICYENVSDLPGYITEKIFDSFFAGCVPVYWGASNVFDYIPRECFIDRREFPDHEGLYSFLKAMSEADYIKYQRAIQTFLASPSAARFYGEAFASNIVEVVLSDF